MRGARWLILAAAVPAILVTGLAPAEAARPPFVFPDGCCFYEGEMVRTVVPPASNPREGRDPFYGIVDGAAGQKGVVAVAPGDVGYHGGHWKFFRVTWNVTPYLLTSAAAVLAAEAAGDVDVDRVPSMDFKCPIQR
jgi:hypothetical protein